MSGTFAITLPNNYNICYIFEVLKVYIIPNWVSTEVDEAIWLHNRDLASWICNTYCSLKRRAGWKKCVSSLI